MNNLGTKHSKIDRFLVSNHVIKKWPSSHVLALSREFSNHTSLVLLNSAPDFGPTSFKLYNSWIEHSDFPMLVHETWASPTVGPPTVAFKTKLKFLKKNIKQWRVKVLQTETETFRDTRIKIDCIDNKAETSPLSSAEIYSRATLVKKLADLEHIKIKNLKQIAKIRWAMEGDENTHFFHGIINNRRNRSRIYGLNIQGEWIINPTVIKNHLFSFFADRFKEVNHSRPLFSSDLFRRLSFD